MNKKTVLQYDNTFFGFLTCVFEAYKEKFEIDNIVGSGVLNDSLFCELQVVETSECKSQRVANGILKKIGNIGLQDVFAAFCSCDRQKELKILNYLRLVFSCGKKVYQMLSNCDVICFNEMLQRVTHECRRMLGFVRFSELSSGIFVSPIRPDNDILQLIFPHFVERFQTQKFAIVDVGRSKAGFFDGENSFFDTFSGVGDIEFSASELTFQKLWKNYFNTVTIASRKSNKLQRQFLPTRYREFLPEFE